MPEEPLPVDEDEVFLKTKIRLLRAEIRKNTRSQANGDSFLAETPQASSPAVDAFTSAQLWGALIEAQTRELEIMEARLVRLSKSGESS